MFYFIPTTYQPNTAATNRAISYIKGFSELGVDTSVVYFRPDENHNRFEQKLTHITYKCYWDKFWIPSMPLMYVSLLYYYLHFIFHLHNDDVVFVYNGAELWYWIKKIKPHVKLYVEHTENPEIVGIGGKFLTPSWSKYYQTLPKLDGLFVISTGLRQYFINKGVPREKIHIANIMVDPHRFDNVQKQKTEKYIAYCGTASNNKDGVDQLIKAFSLIIKDVPDIKLYIMGATPEKDEAGNLKLIKELGIKDKVVLTGIVTSEEMPQYLVNAQLLSLDRPDNIQAKCGFATKLGEYLLSGNPVVLTSVGDFPLFFSDKINVVFAQPDNVRSFADNLLWTITHPEETSAIGLKGRDVALKNFTYIEVSRTVLHVIGLLS